MVLSFRNSLIFKALKFLLLLITAISIFALSISYLTAVKAVDRNTLEQVEILLNTLEPSAQIAAYNHDEKSARDIGRGLLKNPLICDVKLITSDGQTLTLIPNTRVPADAHTPVTRLLKSPVDSSVHVGTLTLALDNEKINERKIQHLHSVLLPAILQTIAVAAAIIWIGFYLLMPEVAIFLHDLEKLNVRNGDMLDAVKYRASGEIQRIAGYINQLIKEMYDALSSEIDQRREGELQLRKMDVIMENAQTGIFVADRRGRLLSYNHACELMAERGGTTLHARSNLLNMLRPALDSTVRKIRHSLQKQKKLHVEVYLPAGNGQSEMWLQLSLTPIDDNNVQGVINDITTAKRESAELQSLALRDPLTKLGNRQGLNLELQNRLTQTQQATQSLSLVTLNLDSFKRVNEQHGHEIGDLVLIRVADKLREFVRNEDYIGRMGGDEFTILLNNISQHEAIDLATKIVDSLNQPFQLNPELAIQVGASVAAVFLGCGQPAKADDLLRQADKIISEVKRNGRYHYSVSPFAETLPQEPYIPFGV